jgi:hypothetical protein
VSTTPVHLLHLLVVLLFVPTLLVKPIDVKSLEQPPSVLVQLSVIVPKNLNLETLVKSMMDALTLPILRVVKLELETVVKKLKLVPSLFLEPLENVELSFKTQLIQTAVFSKPRPVLTMILVLLLPAILQMVFVNQDHLDVLPLILASLFFVLQLVVKKPHCVPLVLIQPLVPPRHVPLPVELPLVVLKSLLVVPPLINVKLVNVMPLQRFVSSLLCVPTKLPISVLLPTVMPLVDSVMMPLSPLKPPLDVNKLVVTL